MSTEAALPTLTWRPLRAPLNLRHFRWVGPFCFPVSAISVFEVSCHQWLVCGCNFASGSKFTNRRAEVWPQTEKEWFFVGGLSFCVGELMRIRPAADVARSLNVLQTLKFFVWVEGSAGWITGGEQGRPGEASALEWLSWPEILTRRTVGVGTGVAWAGRRLCLCCRGSGTACSWSGTPSPVPGTTCCRCRRTPKCRITSLTASATTGSPAQVRTRRGRETVHDLQQDGTRSDCVHPWFTTSSVWFLVQRRHTRCYTTHCFITWCCNKY